MRRHRTLALGAIKAPDHLVFIVDFDDQFLDTGQRLLLRAFFNRLHGYQVQINVVSRETLLDAQAHPEKHRDLIVRVAGYSDHFHNLSRELQDEIIERTEQTIG
mgnify:CR=1 FL=1